MTKKLNIAAITSELEGSAFFPPRQPPTITDEVPRAQGTPARRHDPMASRPHDATASQRHGVTTPQHEAVPHAERTKERLDLAKIPDTRFSLRVTPEEYEALDDLERELRRRYAVLVSKNDLIRCALHHLIEDHQQTKERSLVLSKLQHKK